MNTRTLKLKHASNFIIYTSILPPMTCHNMFCEKDLNVYYFKDGLMKTILKHTLVQYAKHIPIIIMISYSVFMT